MNPDSAKQLKSYLGCPSWQRIVRIALLLLAVVMFVLGANFAGKDVDQSSAIEFYPGEDEMRGKFVYVDVAGVTDPLAERDDEKWYAVLDSEGYGCIVQLYESQFISLKAHNDWFYSEEDYDIEPTRIYGMTNKMSDELAEVLAEVFEYESKEDIYDTFGKFYLDATETPNDTGSAIFFFIGFLALLGSVIMFAATGARNGSVRRSLKRLKQLGLTDRAADELASSVCDTFGDDAVRITGNFLFCRPSGTAVALDDILWVYGHVQRYNGVVTAQTVRAACRTLKEMTIAQAGKQLSAEALSDIITAVMQRRPDILVGYTPENQAAYRELRKQEKEKARNGINS